MGYARWLPVVACTVVSGCTVPTVQITADEFLAARAQALREHFVVQGCRGTFACPERWGHLLYEGSFSSEEACVSGLDHVGFVPAAIEAVDLPAGVRFVPEKALACMEGWGQPVGCLGEREFISGLSSLYGGPCADVLVPTLVDDAVCVDDAE